VLVVVATALEHTVAVMPSEVQATTLTHLGVFLILAVEVERRQTQHHLTMFSAVMVVLALF
tara:strand:+ start:166 stop:348 length:183 start_codon:yes stop_codon:yes gene_type:complete